MLIGTNILRFLLASLAAFWVPLQCCSAPEANRRANGGVDEVQVVAAAVAPEQHCELPCCSRENGDGAVKDDVRPDHPIESDRCDCDSHPASPDVVIADKGPLGIDGYGPGSIFTGLLPVSFPVADIRGDSERLHRTDSPSSPIPAVTLRTLSVLLTV